jgi:CysZ protein
MQETKSITAPLSGIEFFLQGFKLISQPGLRTFVLVPLCINLLLFSGAFYALYLQLGPLMDSLMSRVPDFLSWLHYLLWPILLLCILFIFSYLFSTVANLISAPFNGLLAEKVEQHLTGQPVNDDGLKQVIKDIPRALKREVDKMVYFIPKAIGCLILFLIPVIGQTVAPVLWFLLSCWMMAIQYVDYGFDNHKLSFPVMRDTLKTKRMSNLSFGCIATILSAIPIVNLIVMPVGVCGGTAMWVAHYRKDMTGRS